MRKRNKQIIVRFTDKEYERFMKYVKKSGLSQAGYIRELINGLVPTDLPPPDFHKMMTELRYIGNNINQIAQKAHLLNVIDSKQFDEAYDQYKSSYIKIFEAVMLPRKIKIWQPTIND